jgi:hypothetical protein
MLRTVPPQPSGRAAAKLRHGQLPEPGSAALVSVRHGRGSDPAPAEVLDDTARQRLDHHEALIHSILAPVSTDL